MKNQQRRPKQLSFASYEFAQKKRMTRREKFLAEMEQVVPWARLEALIEPKYPTSGRVGRPPIGIPLMLRMYFLQQWFGLADEALEDAIYDSQSMREFMGIDLARESVPDATTLLKFRRLLEEHSLTVKLFEGINAHLSERGLLLREGTTVDATLIEAPTSTKNKEHERDPEMHQTKKGNEWYFGMKAHIGADADSGLVHSFHATAANESDVAHTHELLHGQETQAFLDAGYIGVEKRPEVVQAQVDGEIRSDIEWNVAKRRSTIKKMAEGTLKTLTQASGAREGADPGAGGAPVPCGQEPVPLQEGPLQGAGEEHGTAVYDIRISQPGSRQETTNGWGATRDECVLRLEMGPERA